MLDNDNNDVIGSVDVLKLRMSMDTEDLENVYTTFNEIN